MKYNTQNAKIESITEKTLIVGIDVGSETHYARAFDWRNYEYSKKPLEFSNNEVTPNCESRKKDTHNPMNNIPSTTHLNLNSKNYHQVELFLM